MRYLVIGALRVTAAIGASGWVAARFATLWWIPIPLAFAVLVVIAVWHQRVTRATTPAAPPWREYRVLDEGLPDELSDVEREMEQANRTATQLRWPEARLTPEQREDAADHAWDKRHMDGQGDQ